MSHRRQPRSGRKRSATHCGHHLGDDLLVWGPPIPGPPSGSCMHPASACSRTQLEVLVGEAGDQQSGDDEESDDQQPVCRDHEPLRPPCRNPARGDEDAGTTPDAARAAHPRRSRSVCARTTSLPGQPGRGAEFDRPGEIVAQVRRMSNTAPAIATIPKPASTTACTDGSRPRHRRSARRSHGRERACAPGDGQLAGRHIVGEPRGRRCANRGRAPAEPGRRCPRPVPSAAATGMTMAIHGAGISPRKPPPARRRRASPPGPSTRPTGARACVRSAAAVDPGRATRPGAVVAAELLFHPVGPGRTRGSP